VWRVDDSCEYSQPTLLLLLPYSCKLLLLLLLLPPRW
jgi:hypothetical protein